MRQLSVFNHVSLDGYFVDRHSSMGWAHENTDAEWAQFGAENARHGGDLLLGRVTYEMMRSFWTSPAASAQAELAASMGRLTKYVVSRTLSEPGWTNSRLLRGELVESVRQVKSEAGGPLVVLGSGTLVSQLTAAGLVDSFQLVINPLVLGSGRTLFADLREHTRLKLVSSRAFKNGNVVLTYAR